MDQITSPKAAIVDLLRLPRPGVLQLDPGAVGESAAGILEVVSYRKTDRVDAGSCGEAILAHGMGACVGREAGGVNRWSMRPLALKNILVATDLTPAHTPALRTAARLAALTGGHLYVVHAIENGGAVDVNEVHARVREAGVDPSIAMDVLVQRAPPGAVVGQTARQVGADVVILGPHRHHDPNTPGGTADRAVRTSAVPCLIVPVELPLPLRRVLAPIDSSATARGALAVALSWASALRDRSEHTQVSVLHVVPYDETAPTHDHDADTRHLEAVIAEVREELSGIAHVDVQTDVVHEESPAHAIVDYAARSRMDLIVIGTRGKSLTNADLLGSVSSVVVRDSRCPVLLVPPERWAGQSIDP